MKKDWVQLEEYILQCVKEIDKRARRSPGSGNGNIKGDISTNCGLKFEMKNNQSLKSAYKEPDMLKIIAEVPLHSQDVPILVTRNKNKKIRVHMEFEDFWAIYKDAFYQRNNG